jgi:Protein of unknown function (DUF4446)
MGVLFVHFENTLFCAMMTCMSFSSTISSYFINASGLTAAGLITGLILFVLLLVLIALIIILHLKVRRLTAGKNGVSLEGAIGTIVKGLENEVRFKKEMEKYLTEVEKRLARSTRSIETVRFNAFSGMGVGGNQSFATALINEHGDGVIISTLNARERMSVFAKPIKAFASEFELSPEEEEALKRAKTNLGTH